MSNIPLTGHSSEQGRYAMKGLLWGALAFLICSIVILSLVPPVSKDELVHHLALPKLYLKHGGMYEIPFMSFSYYPMNLQLLYMIPLYFGDDIAPKLIHFAFALLTAWLIFAYLRARTTTLCGLFGSLLFLSIPVIVKLSTTAYVDLGVVFFTTASLLLLFRWADNGFKLKYLVASALSCGLAMGTKYSALVCFFLLTLTVPFIYAQFTPRTKVSLLHSVRFTLLFFFLAILAFSPWMIRNYSWTKNPLHPLFANWLQQQTAVSSENSGPDSESQSGLNVFAIRRGIYHETGWQTALVPIRIFFEGKDGSPQHFDGKLNPFLILLPFFAFYRVKEAESLKREKAIMLAFSALCFAFAFFTADLRIRYISPMIPPLVILSTFGLQRLIQGIWALADQGGRTIALVSSFFIVLVPLSLNAFYVFDQFRYIQPFDYLRGTVSRDNYIARYRPEYPAMQYINEKVPHDALIMFIFLGDRGYYCDRNYIFGEGIMGELISRAEQPEELAAKLKEKGVTHLLIGGFFFERWLRDNFSEKKQNLLQSFFSRDARSLYIKNGFSVFSIHAL
jgi:4-amino-4-deoxy-L-arabinose transferase-like glycosyltransferase